MPNQVSSNQVIRFATFEVDLQAQELRKAGLRLKLSGQPFQGKRKPEAVWTRGSRWFRQREMNVDQVPLRHSMGTARRCD
jgi:hypothetical protein